MITSTITAALDADISTVWRIVTDARRYAEWRGDLGWVEAEDKLHFTEYTRDGFATRFTVTQSHAPELWELHIENANLTGRWLGEFESLGKKTGLRFTEYIRTKKPIPAFIVKCYLKKQQKAFIDDLKASFQSYELNADRFD